MTRRSTDMHFKHVVHQREQQTIKTRCDHNNRWPSDAKPKKLGCTRGSARLPFTEELQCFLESDPNEHLPDPPQLCPMLAAIGLHVGDTTAARSHNDGQNRI